MGNLCGKIDKSDDHFDQPGRTLGGGTAGGGTRPAPATGPQAKTAPVPARVGGPPRTLGGGSGGGAGSSAAADARARAAAAAEVRDPKSSPTTG